MPTRRSHGSAQDCFASTGTFGRTKLYLLDTNDAANVPVHRGITSELHKQRAKRMQKAADAMEKAGGKVEKAGTAIDKK